MAESRFTIGLNLQRNAPFQWDNFDFNSMGDFNGVPIAANSDGLYTLFDADDDDGTNIDAFFELPTSDLGMPNAKAIRALMISGEMSGTLLIKTTVNEDTEREYFVVPKSTGQTQNTTHRVNGRRDQVGAFWMFRVENKAGCDFSIDAIDSHLVILGM